MNSKFTKEDLETRDAIGAVIYNNNGEILIQDHIKLDFFTIPIGKVKVGENIEKTLIQELSDELGIQVINYTTLVEKEGIYDYDGVKIIIKNHIFKILSYQGEITNKEPSKHRSIGFMSIEKIKQLPKISDATKIAISKI